MAESMDETQNSWWGGWLQSAKEKSMAAVDFMKRDLAEFTNTMSHDTSKIVEVTSATIKDTLKAENTTVAKDKVKESINTLFNGLSKALTVPPDEDDDDDPKLRQASEGAAIFDRSKARLHAIQVDPGTYLNEPSGPEGLFEDWAKEFNMDDKKGHISEVLVTNVEVRALYTKLVPLQISHTDFWQRYFYKLHQLEMDEVRKQAMMKRAEREREDSIGWEDDWSGDEEFEELSHSDLKPASETSPKLEHDAANASSSVLRQTPEKNTQTVSPARENNPVNVSPSSLQPLPERGKAVSPDVSQSEKQQQESEVQKNIPAACDKLPSSQDEVIPSNQETKQSASSVKEEEKVVPNVNQEQNVQPEGQQPLVACDVPVTNSNSEPQPPVVENVPSASSETVTSVNAAQDVSSTPASSSTKSEKEISPSTNSAAVQSDTTSTKVDINNSQPPQPEVSQQSSQEVVADALPQKTIAAEKPSAEVIPETAQSVVAQKPGEAEVAEKSQQEAQSQAEEVDSAPSGAALDIKTKIKGDMVVVGSDSESPNSDSSGTKEFLHLVPDAGTEDWEHDFDLEVTEEDLKAADEIAKNLGTDLDLQDDDWENWE